MKRVSAGSLVLVVLLFGGPVAAQSVPPVPVSSITVVADEWPPFNMVPGANREGYMIDVLREVFEPAGIAVRYLLVPWNRALSDTRSGVFTAAVGASKVDGAGLVFPKEELSVNRLTFFTRAESSWTFRGLPSLAEVSLGVIDGYDYRQWLNEYIDRYAGDDRRVQVVRGDQALEANFRKLLNRRVDAIVDSETTLRFTALELGISDRVRMAGQDDQAAEIYVAFSPALPYSRTLAEMLSRGIEELRRSGRLASILARYGLTDWKEK
ncbi:substrate-binding periplasmic protein [Salinispira pacifica]